MQDNQERVEIQADPTMDATNVDTQQPESTQSPAEDTSGHDDAQPVSDDSTTSASTTVDPADYQRLKREEGKLKQTQKEREKLEQEKRALQEWILADPGRTRAALIESEGYTPEQADEVIRKNAARWDKTAQQQTQAPQYDPYQLAREAAREELQQQTYVNKFFGMFPDLAPDKTKDEDELARRRDTALSIDRLAATYKSVDATLSDDEALTQAYKFVTKKSDEDISKAREEGKIEGLLIANGQKAASGNAPTASQGTRGQPQLSDLERNIADQMIAKGVIKDYAEYAAERTPE